MPRGLDTPKQAKKPWKTQVERDIIMHEDIEESGLEGGKVIAEKLALLSFVLGIPLLAVGLWALSSMILGLGFPVNNATIIMGLLVMVIGLLLVTGGFFLYRDKHLRHA